uniref:TlpA family protein disulfide reductase n=1 Tax=Pedobacter schmidteae TaxID=2201271 RepID=UPI000EAF304F|nr:thioredoxin domain-containing protein [Pedobacter schmidteae]
MKHLNIKLIICLFIIMQIGNLSSAQLYKKSYPSALKFNEIISQIYVESIIDHNGNIEKSNDVLAKESKLKGKLIILDFWSTTCGTCINGFPRMSELQKEFGDSLQIYLVNTIENDDKISKWIKNLNSKSYVRKVIPQNLKIITSKKLATLFPLVNEIGYSVWIGKDGKFLFRGISENTNSQKVREYFRGSTLKFIEDKPYYRIDADKPFFAKENRKIQYNSTFTDFLDTLISPYGFYARNVVDSTKGTRRYTFLNLWIQDVLSELYANNFPKKILLMPQKLELNIKDSIRRSIYEKSIQKEDNDETYVNARICYEHISPVSISDNDSRDLMKEDLNNYLRNTRKIKVQQIQKNITCYQLVIFDKSKLKPNTDNATWISAVKPNDRPDKMEYAYKGFELGEMLRLYLLQADYKRINKIVVDGTLDKGKYDVVLPSSGYIKDINELNNYLKVSGLMLIEKELEIPFIEISDI